MNKEAILDNVTEYTADQLVGYIQIGIVTMEELIRDTEGQFSPDKRKEVQKKLENADPEAWQRVQNERSIETCSWYLKSFPNGKFRNDVRSMMDKLQLSKKDDDAWNAVDQQNIDSLRAFIKDHPRNIHVGEAQRLIDAIIRPGLEAETLISDIRRISMDSTLTIGQKDYNIINLISKSLDKNNVKRRDFLDKIEEDHNLLSSGIIKTLIDSEILSRTDLYSLNINREFVDKACAGVPTVSLSTLTVPKLEKIEKKSTEIYFWGIPSSGKSCALGAILSVANSGTVAHSMDPDNCSQGYGYMNRLMGLFRNGMVEALIEGTAINSFYEMGFNLVDTDRNVHPITCIDMAGELMRCMYKYDASEPMSQMDTEMLDTLTKVLIDNRSVNRKIHVFVIEYGAENRLYEGLRQRTYLDGAVAYIKRTGIFKKETDAIYLMITKVDKAREVSTSFLNSYIEENYRGFYNALETICVDNEINGGKVEKIFFSLGDVCFQNYCKFDARPAANMVKNVLLGRTAYYRPGRLNKWIEAISK